jgi:hypothetical protein
MNNMNHLCIGSRWNSVPFAALGFDVLEGVGDQHGERCGLASDTGEQRGKYADEEYVPADRAEVHFQRLAQIRQRVDLDAVGTQDFGADDPDRELFGWVRAGLSGAAPGRESPFTRKDFQPIANGNDRLISIR